MENKKEPVCRFGHICTSRCGNDIECPCLADHCCEISVRQSYCDGTCDDCFTQELKGETYLAKLIEIVDENKRPYPDNSINWEKAIPKLKDLISKIKYD